MDYASSLSVKNFFNLAFENRIFPVINRATRVAWPSATAIDHILTNTIMDQDLQNGIIKLDISLLSDFYNLEFQNTQPVSKNKIINTNQKRSVGRTLKNILSSTDWKDVLGKTITNESHDQFIKKFSLIYDDCFPIKVIEIKIKVS